MGRKARPSFLKRKGFYQINVLPQEKTTGETHSEAGRHDTSGVGAKKRRSKQGRPTKRWEDDTNTYSQSDRTNGDNNNLADGMICLTTAEDTSKWNAMESDFINSRLKQPARPTTSANTTMTSQPTTHEQTTYTTDAHDQNEDDTKDDDDTLLILSQPNAPLHQSYHMMGTRSNSSNQGFS